MTQLEVRSLLKDHFSEKWPQGWASRYTARKVYQTMLGPSKSDQTLITHIRTEHCATLNYLRRFDTRRDIGC